MQWARVLRAGVKRATLRRFKRQAKLAAKIQHATLVNIFDFGLAGESRNIPFIVMELLSGHDLEAQIFSPAFDVYQMGLILVETLTGKAVVDEMHPLRCVKAHSMRENLPTQLSKHAWGCNSSLCASWIRCDEIRHNAFMPKPLDSWGFTAIPWRCN